MYLKLEHSSVCVCVWRAVEEPTTKSVQLSAGEVEGEEEPLLPYIPTPTIRSTWKSHGNVWEIQPYTDSSKQIKKEEGAWYKILLWPSS